jgi:hypothetical protein
MGEKSMPIILELTAGISGLRVVEWIDRGHGNVS